jgi:nucleoside-diphosphate-sugar epimerase
VKLLLKLYLQVRIARIFNTYGPRMCIDDGRVVSNFVAQVCALYKPPNLLAVMSIITQNSLESVNLSESF